MINTVLTDPIPVTLALDGQLVLTGTIPPSSPCDGPDFDGDGRCDILWQDETTAAGHIFQMNGPSIPRIPSQWYRALFEAESS